MLSIDLPAGDEATLLAHGCRLGCVATRLTTTRSETMPMMRTIAPKGLAAFPPDALCPASL